MIKKIKEYFMIILGTVLLTAGVYFFKIPNGFVTGGVSGIGTILGSVFTFLSPLYGLHLLMFFCLSWDLYFLGKRTA